MTPRPNFILGIDPGLQGALALYDNRLREGELIPTLPSHAVWDMPINSNGVDPHKLANLIAEIGWDHAGLVCVIENVSSRPRQAGAFNFGLGAGMLQGVLAAHAIPFTLVSPSVWKVAMGLQRKVGADLGGPLGAEGETQKQNKTRARKVASLLLPDMEREFARVKDDGRAEAMLLAIYFANLPSK